MRDAFRCQLKCHGWRTGQCGLLRTPERRVFRRIGNRPVQLRGRFQGTSFEQLDLQRCRHRASPKTALACPPVSFAPLTEKLRKIRNVKKDGPWPAGMVLLENFGPAFAEAPALRKASGGGASSRPFTAKINRLNRNKSVFLPPRNVVRAMRLRFFRGF